jgi:hypothetical protein
MWRIKILIQFVLSRLPFGEVANYALGAALRPGAHAPATLRRRLPAYLETLRRIRNRRPLAGARVFEVGTGWCPIALVLLHLAGVKSIRSVDHVPHLRWALVRSVLEACGTAIDEIATAVDVSADVVRSRWERLNAARDLGGFLEAAAIEYVAPADARSSGLPEGSVDIWYTYSVLEYVPRSVLPDIFREARRIMAPEGIWFSLIGCQDPYASRTWGGRVNYLQYSEAGWNFWTSNSLAHNNRLRERDFLELLRAAGFRIEAVQGARHPEDLKRLESMRVDSRFRGYTIEELAVHRSEILALPN